MFLEEQLIFFPSRFPEGEWNPPGVTFEDIWFTADDGVRLHGWYLPHPQARGVLLFAHGNAGHLAHRADVMRTLRDRMSLSVMIFDYRGYGRSEQTQPTEQGVLRDARAARSRLARRAGVAESDIILMGESLGGAVMVDLAAGDGARALILENTFTSVPDLAAVHYSWIPVRMLVRTRLNSLEKIPAYHGPLFQAHGDADRIIPFELGQKLFAAAGEPKEFFVVPGGDHNDPRTEEYYRALEKFLDRVTKKAASPGF